MENKVKQFIYINPDNYISLEDLKVTYLCIMWLPVLMSLAIGGAVKSPFPAIASGIWNAAYLVFIGILQSKRTKKTFRLRFLVNGVASVLLSSLFLLLLSFICLYGDGFEAAYFWIALACYVGFILLYMCLIVYGVHRGAYNRRNIIKSSGVIAAVIMIVCFAVMAVRFFYIANPDNNGKEMFIPALFALIVLLCGLGHINFIQYFYCVKYNINCDRAGKNTSPRLEYTPKPKKERVSQKRPKKKKNIFLKIFLILLGVPAALYAVIFIVFFVKAIVEKLM